MKVLRKDMVELCETLGFATASKWSKERMAGKLKEIAETACDDALPKVEDERLAKILKELVKANGECTVFQGVIPEEEAAEALTEQEAADEEECKKLNEDINRLAEGKKPKVPKASKVLKAPKEKKPVVERKRKGEPGPDVGSPSGVNSIRNRLFYCGVVLREKGLSTGVTDELVEQVFACLPKLPDKRASEIQLRSAWHVVNGYVNGKMPE